MRTLLLRDGKLIPDVGIDEIAKTISSRVGVLWVDLHTGEADSADILRDVFKFHPLAIEDCFNGVVQTPKVDDYGSYLFMVAQSVEPAADSQTVEVIEVDLFLGKNYVVSVRKEECDALDELFSRACENVHFLNRGADFLAHTILDSLVDQLLPAVETLDEEIDTLEQRILENPTKELLPDILRLKRTAIKLRRSILPERDMVNRISRGEFGELIDRQALIFYRDVYDHIVRVDEMLEGVRDLADGALSSYLSAVNNRMNETMKAMSVVAVIFLPLTLIASIYGTNLDFSPFGINFGHGFLLMILTMLAVASGLILYFRRRGWF